LEIHYFSLLIEDDNERTVTVAKEIQENPTDFSVFIHKRLSKYVFNNLLKGWDTSHIANYSPNNIKQLLSQSFGEQVIRGGFHFEWLDRNPNLTSCDFWLRGHLKINI